MLTTQIGGLLQRIAARNEEAVEETARLLAQATIGEGRVIFIGLHELEAVTLQAIQGAETFHGAVRYIEGMEISSADRVWLLTRSATDEVALQIARDLVDRFIPFAVLTTENADDENELADLAYTYMSTGLVKGLLPSSTGERIVQPHGIAALFLYEAVKLAYDEMVFDLE